MFTHILVPTDGSPPSYRAALAAVALARMCSAKVTALHVQPQHPFPVSLYPPDEVEVWERQYRESAARHATVILGDVRKMAEQAAVRVDVLVVLNDRPWEAICQTAQSLDCDLIAMASHADPRDDTLAPGGQTTRVLAHARVPVLIYR